MVCPAGASVLRAVGTRPPSTPRRSNPSRRMRIDGALEREGLGIQPTARQKPQTALAQPACDLTTRVVEAG